MALPISSILTVVLCAAGLIAFFVIGLSLTQMIKGHPIDSEISTNKNMKKLGIKCAVQETREQMQAADCDDSGTACSGNCAACESGHLKSE